MTTITEQVRAAAEEIASMWAFLSHPQTATVRALEAIITKHVHPASLAEPKKLVDEIDDLLSEAIGYDYTNRGPAMIALERLVERNSAPVGPSLTDAIEVVKRLRDEWDKSDDPAYITVIKMRAATEIITTLASLEGKAPVGERVTDKGREWFDVAIRYMRGDPTLTSCKWDDRSMFADFLKFWDAETPEFRSVISAVFAAAPEFTNIAATTPSSGYSFRNEKTFKEHDCD